MICFNEFLASEEETRRNYNKGREYALKFGANSSDIPLWEELSEKERKNQRKLLYALKKKFDI